MKYAFRNDMQAHMIQSLFLNTLSNSTKNSYKATSC